MIDFDEINSAALMRYPSLLECWLPGGKLDGREYRCGDISGGTGRSMSVNTQTGKWSDFAASLSGGDPVSLYAAINNIEQGEAAKRLSAEFALAPPPKPQQKNKKKDKPVWTAQPVAPESVPEPDFRHWKHGNPVKIWEYYNQDRQRVGYVCRFNLPPVDGKPKKEVLPLCWGKSDGGTQEWRWLSFPKPRPLYNLLSVASFPDDKNIIIVEGEKCVDALQPLLKMPVVSWPGGSKAVHLADWSPLAGRKVVIWPDFDSQCYGPKHKKAGQLMPYEEQPGRKAALKIAEILVGLGCEVKVIGYQLEEFLDGYDCADMIEADLSINSKQIMAFLKPRMEEAQKPEPAHDQLPEEPPMPTETPEDCAADYMPNDEENEPVNMPFQCLGYDRGCYFYLSSKTKQVVELKPESHGGKSLLQLAPLSWWERKFPGKNSANWEAAADALIMKCNEAGVFNPSRIRGRGAWEDAGRSVLHVGEQLVVNGSATNINDFDTRYIYEVARELDQKISNEKLSGREADKFADLCELLSWSKPINAALLAGWCVVAPICGALSWRPHMWLTGGKGTGKTWILENIIKPTVGGSALSVMSSTTEAGIRQTLGNDARPVVFDEAEGEDKSARKRIQAVLELARQASSEAAAAIFKGTATGRSMAFHIRSCFLFASIGVSITQDSDASRISILSLVPNRDSDRFDKIRRDVFGLLTPEYCAALRARSVALIPQIRKNAEIFARAGAEYLGSQRTGDQIGALLAGYYSLKRSDEITLERAREWIAAQAKEGGWEDVAMTDGDDTDEKRCLAAILGHVVRIKDREVTLGELVEESLGYINDKDELRRAAIIQTADKTLRRYGIRPEERNLQKGFIVSNTSEQIKAILQGTPWASGWRGLLLRLELAEKTDSVTFAPGVRARGVFVDQFSLGDCN